MDTTNPEEEETTTQDPLLTEEGGAISKQTAQTLQATTGTTEDDEQQQPQAHANNPVDESSISTRQHENDDPYGVPGEIALDMIEEQTLKKQEDRDLFHTPVIKVSQDEFASIHNKTRRSFQEATRNMASTKTICDNYLQAKSRLPMASKIMMEDILPPHAHTWHIRNALAFKAAISHLKKEQMPVTGPTDEKTLYRLVMSQARLRDNLYRSGGTSYINDASGYTPTPMIPKPQQSALAPGKYGPRSSYTAGNIPAPVEAILDMHQRLEKIDIYAPPNPGMTKTQRTSSTPGKAGTRRARMPTHPTDSDTDEDDTNIPTQ